MPSLGWSPMLLSQRKYAESRRARGLSGGTLEAVRKAISSKRITLVVEPGTGKLKIDPAIADAQWTRNTDLEQQLRATSGTFALVSGSRSEDEDPDVDGGDDADRKELLQHKTAAAKADAQLKTMAALERAGELVVWEELKKQIYDAVRSLRNRLQMVPDRIPDPRSREVAEKEINKALDELASAFRKLAAAAGEGTGELQ